MYLGKGKKGINRTQIKRGKYDPSSIRRTSSSIRIPNFCISWIAMDMRSYVYPTCTTQKASPYGTTFSWSAMIAHFMVIEAQSQHTASCAPDSIGQRCMTTYSSTSRAVQNAKITKLTVRNRRAYYSHYRTLLVLVNLLTWTSRPIYHALTIEVHGMTQRGS